MTEMAVTERAHTMSACYFLEIDGCGEPAAWRYEEAPLKRQDVCEKHHDFMASEPALWPGTWARMGEAARK